MGTPVQKIWQYIIDSKEVDYYTYHHLKKFIYPLIEEEKQMIEQAFLDGANWDYNVTSEDYYNEKFNN